MNVEVKQLPSRRVGYVRYVGPYGPQGAGQAFGELMRWAGPRGLAAGAMLGVCWDDPTHTPADKCRYDACVVLPDEAPVDGMSVQTIEGGDYAVYHTEIMNNDFGGAWDRMYQWLSTSGYRPRELPSYEHYLNDGMADPDGKWLIELCVPVAPL